jgi:hypothetical protein
MRRGTGAFQSRPFRVLALATAAAVSVVTLTAGTASADHGGGYTQGWQTFQGETFIAPGASGYTSVESDVGCWDEAYSSSVLPSSSWATTHTFTVNVPEGTLAVESWLYLTSDNPGLVLALYWDADTDPEVQNWVAMAITDTLAADTGGSCAFDEDYGPVLGEGADSFLPPGDHDVKIDVLGTTGDVFTVDAIEFGFHLPAEEETTTTTEEPPPTTAPVEPVSAAAFNEASQEQLLGFGLVIFLLAASLVSSFASRWSD